MKKKIVNGFLMLALLVSSMGSFVSCKDYDEDIYVDLKGRISDQASLYEGLQKQVNNLEAAVAALENAKCNCEKDDLSEYVKVADLDGYMTTEEGDKLLKIEEFVEYRANNDTAIKLLQEAINSLKSELETLKVEVASNTKSITKLTELVNSANNTAIEAKAKAEEALSLAKQNAEAIKTLQEKVAANELQINSLTNVVNTLQKSVTNVQNTVQELNTTVINLGNTVAGWDKKLTDLLNRTEGIVAQVESNTTRIEQLEKLYDELLEANKLLADYEKVQELINQLRYELEQMNKKWGEDLEKAKKDALDAANEAKKIANDALTKAGIALSTAEKALSTASNAEQLALSALKTAQNAQNAADEAAKKAEDALKKVQDLVAKAEAAKTAAEAAQKAAEEAAALAKKYAEEAAAAGGGLTDEWKSKIQKALDDAAAAKATADAAKAAADAADAKAETAKATADAAKAEADAMQKDVNDLKEAVKNFITSDDLATELAKYAKESDLTSKYNELKGLIDGLTKWDEDRIAAIEQAIQDLKGTTPSGLTLEKVQDWVKANYYNQSDIDDLLKTKLADYLQKDVLDNYFTKGNINDKIKEINDKITPLEEKVTEIQKEISDLKSAIEKLKIVSLKVQGTANPTIGYFNLPIDVKSNMLVVYYGNQNKFMFPSSSTFEDDELAAMGVSSASEIPGRVVHGGGKFISGDPEKDYEGNAGTVYMTINPTDASLDDVEFSLVNTQDKESGVKLSKPQASDKVLKFGYQYTRSGADLGFYESKATMKIDDIDGNLLSVDPEALLTQAQNALKEKSLGGVLSTGLSFFESFNNKLDCNAVKAKWADGVATSDFNIAACAIEPLAIDMLKPLDLPGLPGIERLQDLVAEIINQIKIKVPDINFDPTKYTDRIQFKDVEVLGDDKVVVNLTVKIDGSWENVKITVDLPAGSENAKTLTDLINYIMSDNASIKVTTDNGSEVNANLREALTQLFNDLKQINAFDEQMRVNIEKAKQDMIEGLQPYIIRLYDRLSQYYGKIKNIFDLIVIARQENGAVAMLSKSLSMPTKATGKLDLIPTSFTFELFAPAYKKIVAVTNVYKADGTPAEKSLAVQANSGENMAKVIDGKVVATLEGQAGYIYEVTLAAVDYHAKEVKEKFYVQF